MTMSGPTPVRGFVLMIRSPDRIIASLSMFVGSLSLKVE